MEFLIISCKGYSPGGISLVMEDLVYPVVFLAGLFQTGPWGRVSLRLQIMWKGQKDHVLTEG